MSCFLPPRAFSCALILATTVCLLRGETASDEDSSYRPMFNGKDLTGWIPRGGHSSFEVIDGVLVGTCIAGSPSTYLCTTNVYADFILKLEYQIDSEMNSGVQIRTQVVETPETYTKANGKKRTRKVGSIYGYQVELDPTERAWTGGIYDQSRRGWLQTLEGKPEARKASKAHEWNRLRVECRGNRIRTWINGIEAADLKDSRDSTGVIGLQIHGAGRHQDRIGSKARFRHIRIREL